MAPKLPVLFAGSATAQRRLAQELRRALADLRQAGTILPSTLPGAMPMPAVRANDTPSTFANRAAEAIIPQPTTPAEQTARPGLIRRAIRSITNRLADALSAAGRRNRGGTAGNAARETLRRLRGRE